MTTNIVVSNRLSAFMTLGRTVTGTFTAEDAMKIGQLGEWNVRKEELVTASGVPVPDKFAVLRDDPEGGVGVLGVVGKSHHTVQNEEHAEFLNTLVDESGAHFEAAGELQGGRRVFFSMKLPGHLKIGGEDRVDNYITAINSHDGSMSFTFVVHPMRFACLNVCNAQNLLFRVRHTSGVSQGLVVQAREALDLTFTYLEEFQEQAEKMIQKTLTQQRFENIIAKNFGAPEDAGKATVTRAEKRLDKMAELFADAITQDGIRGTAWAGFNAITEWADHYAPARGDDPEASRALRSLLDPGIKQKALQLMLAVK